MAQTTPLCIANCKNHDADGISQPTTFPSTVTVINEKESCKESVVSIIHPYGVFRLLWDVFVMILLIYTCVEVPFTLAFDMVLTLKMPLGVCALLIDCLLLLDVYFNFRTAYYDRYNPFQLITKPSEIAKQYVKTWFILDLLTSIPFEFMVPTNHEATRFIKLLRVFRLLRLLKLLRFVRMMKTFNNVLRGILTRWVVMLLKLFRIVCLMILCAHYIACIWWFFGKESLKYYEESWIMNDKLNMLESDITVTQQYIKAYYFSVVTLYTTGYGDITPMNSMEEVVGSVVILIGTMAFAYFIGAVSGLITEGDRIRSAQTQKIEEAQAFCAAKKLPAPLSIQVMTHLKYYWATNPCDACELDDEKVIKCLPPQIQRSVAKHCDRQYCIDQLSIFKPLNAYIRGLIALKLKCVSASGDEYVFREQEFGKRLYIQRTGTSLLESQFNAECIKSGRGTVCGYFSFIKPQRLCSLFTLSYSEFWCLDYDDVRSILKQSFPRSWQRFWSLIENEIEILHSKHEIYLRIDHTRVHGTKNEKRTCNPCGCLDIHCDGDRRDEKIKKTGEKIKGTLNYQKEMNSMQKQTKRRRMSLMKEEEELDPDEETKADHDAPVNEKETVRTVQLLTVPKQRNKAKKKKKKKKKEILFMNEEDSSSNSMFGENSLNSLSKSIIVNDGDDHLGPLLSDENGCSDDISKHKTMIVNTRKYSLIESRTKSD